MQMGMGISVIWYNAWSIPHIIDVRNKLTSATILSGYKLQIPRPVDALTAVINPRPTRAGQSEHYILF
jgi:hypothetical protein